MKINKSSTDLTRFNLSYNFKTKSFDLPKRIRLPDIPLSSDALKDINNDNINILYLSKSENQLTN